MGKYILKRILLAAVILFIILFLLFLMLEFMPGSPFNDERLSDIDKAILVEKYGLDGPFITRFFSYFFNVLKGDFGLSYNIQKGVPISEILSLKIGVTIRLALQAIIFGVLFGSFLGIFAGIKRGTLADSGATIMAVIGVSIPSYVLALLMKYFIAYKWKLFPTIYDYELPFKSSILPTIALSLFVIAQVARFLRMELVTIFQSDYIKLATAKGVPKKNIIIKHSVRNALIPVITILGPLVVSLMVGSLVVEKIFVIPGIGNLLIEAIQNNDFNIVLAIAFIFSLLFVVINLIIDILYGVIDPRIRVSGGEK